MECCEAVVRPTEFASSSKTCVRAIEGAPQEGINVKLDRDHERECSIPSKSTVVKSLEDAWRRRDKRESPFSKLAGPISWQNAVRDHHMRRSYVERILELLELEAKWREGSFDKDAHNLPSLAKRLEYHLYTEAKTLQEYDDSSSLRKRLEVFITQLHEKKA